jgi:hypothetical protein
MERLLAALFADLGYPVSRHALMPLDIAHDNPIITKVRDRLL